MGEKKMKNGTFKGKIFIIFDTFYPKIIFFPEISFISHISAIKPLNNICRLVQPYISSGEEKT